MLSAKDQSLYERLINKDEKALRMFYTEHQPALQQFLLRKLDAKDAEEVLQDSFIGFLESLRNFRKQSSLKTFLYSIAKRKAIDKLRKEKVKRVLFSYLPDGVVDSLAKVFFSHDLDKKFVGKKIEKVFESLPNDYALVLRLKYKNDYSVKDIAEEIGQSFKATESLLFRARKAFIKTYNTYERQGLFSLKEEIR